MPGRHYVGITIAHLDYIISSLARVRELLDRCTAVRSTSVRVDVVGERADCAFSDVSCVTSPLTRDCEVCEVSPFMDVPCARAMCILYVETGQKFTKLTASQADTEPPTSAVAARVSRSGAG